MRFFIAIFFIFLSTISQAQLIRDTEIENALRVFSHPFIERAGLETSSVRLHIIKDDSLNAFVAGGQRIFIHTGTMIEVGQVEELLAVIAHEVGHIAGGHLASLHETSKAAGRQALLSLLVGIPLALSGNANAAIGVGLASGNVARGQVLNYTQSMESAADQAAIGYLAEEQITAEGMVAFLKRLQKLEKIYGERAAYLRSHPLTKERIVAAESAVASERDVMTPQVLQLLLARVRGKLIGHLWEHRRVMVKYPAGDNSVEGRYARGFSYMMRGLLDEALVEVDSLLAEFPNDVFFLEAKGDIYRNAGRMGEAREYYGRALAIAPWAALIHSQWANSLSDVDKGDDELVGEALGHVREALRLEPNLYSAWVVKGGLESVLGRVDLVDLANAEVALLRGDVDRALFLARRVEGRLNGGVEYEQALDIINRGVQLKD